MRSLFVILVVATTWCAAAAQTPCASPEARQLDFWLGEWELTWEGGSGTNHITRLFDDCAVEENFAGEMPWGTFHGRSLSVYDARRGVWRQTWVDNQGSYLAFEGGLGEDGIVRLLGEPGVAPDGRAVVQRMSWTEVTEDSLVWRWERSFDEGETWEATWVIDYERSARER
jgi:hypothetical protein